MKKQGSYARPNDPATPGQRRWRAHFAAVSAAYSGQLSDEQQDECIAQGAKLRRSSGRSPSDSLSGLQYWMHRELTGRETATKAKRALTAQVSPYQQLAQTPTV